MQYVTPKQAAAKFGVCLQTLRRWAASGKIKYQTTSGGHRRYGVRIEPENKVTYLYARVSSQKQKKDLQRQAQYLTDNYQGPQSSLITDIGSGINFRRKGFQKILDQLFEGNLQEVVVASPDRFVRCGFEFFEDLFERFGAKLTYLTNKKPKTSSEELAEDLLSMVTVFTARYHGRRKYQNKVLSEDPDLSGSGTKEDV